MSIEITNLTKTFGSQVAVNNISFKVGKGEIVGFLGPNGAGKSTTMKMVTGYLAPDSGTVLVGGVQAGRRNVDAKRKIGYLPEANPLYTDMYVREYLGFIAHVHEIKDASRVIEDVIKTVGLSLESKKKIGQLSKGYKQRVGLAAALVHDPEVLILDEPTSGLDPNQIIEIRSVIKQLAENKTVLFSSHIMQEVEALCDRVIIINRGNIVADDKLSVLKNTSGKNELVIVEFSNAVSTQLISTIKGAESVKVITPSSFSISCSNPDDIRKQLLQLSIDHNLNITSLRSESQSLESVFKSLTT